MWESTVRLVGDDEAAHKALTQLKKAIRSRSLNRGMDSIVAPACPRLAAHRRGDELP